MFVFFPQMKKEEESVYGCERDREGGGRRRESNMDNWPNLTGVSARGLKDQRIQITGVLNICGGRQSLICLHSSKQPIRRQQIWINSAFSNSLTQQFYAVMFWCAAFEILLVLSFKPDANICFRSVLSSTETEMVKFLILFMTYLKRVQVTLKIVQAATRHAIITHYCKFVLRK